MRSVRLCDHPPTAQWPRPFPRISENFRFWPKIETFCRGLERMDEAPMSLKRMANDPPMIIEGPEQSRLDPARADGGLAPAVGVQSFQVFRASRDVPELSDGYGWTYHHHVDMAC